MKPFGTALRLAFIVILVGLFVAAGGAAYNTLSNRHYRNVVRPPGKIYEMAGQSLHLYCTGQGSPTVVLSAGLGDDSLGWVKVQPVLSKETRVCSYDRAGFGWSGVGRGVQDANSVSDQLHELIGVAGVGRPFILVGHSISGLYLRAYAARYPSDLAGLIFVDGATPLQDARIPKGLVEIQKQQRRQMPWQKLLMTLGWYRIQGICTSIPPGAEAYAAWIKADSCIPSQMDAIENELDAEQTSGEETADVGPFGDLPILVLSHDPNVLPSNWPVAVSKDMAGIWNQMQEETKDLSSQSRRIIAKGSDHYIQNDRPDLLNHEAAAFVEMIRNHRGFSNNRSTTVE